MKITAVSGIMLTLLLLVMLIVIFRFQPVKGLGTIYIRADGSVDPPTANITSVNDVTYSFTGNIFNYSIVVEKDNIVVDGAGYTVQGTGAWGSNGIDLSGRNNVTIKNVQVINFRYGIWLQSSSNNVLADNTVHSNNWAGVQLSWSSNHNTVSGNNITNNNQDGVALYYSSSFNTISGNSIANHNRDGVAFYSSSNNNTVSRNNITNNNAIGVRFDLSSFNTVSGNNIINNGDGVFLWSSNHKIYHNNFINNTNQAGSFEPNTWDDGYPSGGNYWSDYTGVDEKSGPNQDEPSSDGIGDIPYVIDENNQDSYPLMYAWVPPPDTTSPSIYIASPENKTHSVEDIPLTFTVNESTSWIGYSLDGQVNVTIAGNTTLSGLSDGPHSLIIYSNDTAGNIGASEMVYFSVETKKEEPFPTLIVAAIVVIGVVGAALLVYFTKVKKTTQKPK